MYIYIDESGILTEGQGRFFIFAAYVTNDLLAADRCIKRIRRNYLKKEYKEAAELKFHNTSHEIRIRILNCIIKHDINIYYIVHEKRHCPGNQMEVKGKLLNTLLAQILADSKDKPQIFIDNFLKKSVQTNFVNQYLNVVRGEKCISFVDSHQYAGIQIADFIAGALSTIINNPNNSQSIEYASIIQEKAENTSDPSHTL